MVRMRIDKIYCVVDCDDMYHLGGIMIKFIRMNVYTSLKTLRRKIEKWVNR